MLVFRHLWFYGKILPVEFDARVLVGYLVIPAPKHIWYNCILNNVAIASVIYSTSVLI